MMPLATGQPPCEGGRVVEVLGLVGQVFGAGVGLDAFVLVQACGGGSASDAGGDLAGVAAEHGQCPVVHPCLGARVAFSEEAPHCAPQVLKYVDQVDHDGDVYASGLGFCLDAVDLMVVAVEQGYPAACVIPQVLLARFWVPIMIALFAYGAVMILDSARKTRNMARRVSK